MNISLYLYHIFSLGPHYLNNLPTDLDDTLLTNYNNIYLPIEPVRKLSLDLSTHTNANSPKLTREFASLVQQYTLQYFYHSFVLSLHTTERGVIS